MDGSPHAKEAPMTSSFYKSYLIVRAADYRTVTSDWKPWVTISWPQDGGQLLHTIQFVNETFKTASEAEQFAVSSGQKWIDAAAVSFVPAASEYRRKLVSDTWHFCTNCAQWPTAKYMSTPERPKSEYLCNECTDRHNRGDCSSK